MNIKRVVPKMTGAIALLAVSIGIMSVQSACLIWFHQPAVPKGMERFMKKQS